MTADEIVSHVPTINLGNVYVALAYYFDHIEELQQEMRAEGGYVERFRRSNPSLIEAKLRQAGLEEASWPVVIRLHFDEHIAANVAAFGDGTLM